MARGGLVPDEVVVAIVADRIDQADAKRGFILDGFPRTVPQAEALDGMLEKKGFRLDAVLELKVDPDILVRRIENRVHEMKRRGEALRADDNPEVLKQRLTAYQAQTAPLVDYYRGKGALRTVDGMASISDVGVAIGRALADAAFRPIASPGSRGVPAGPPPPGLSPPEGQRRQEAPGKVKGPGSPKHAPRRPPRPPRRGARRRQGGPRAAPPEGPQKSRKAALAEVDETRLNPLISPVSSRTKFERCRPPEQRGGRRIIALDRPAGTPEQAGTARRNECRPEQERSPWPVLPA